MPENVSKIQIRTVSFVSSDTVSKILPNPGSDMLPASNLAAVLSVIEIIYKQRVEN